MKKKTLALLVMMALIVLTFASCTESGFGIEGNPEEGKMVVTAENADAEAEATTAGLFIKSGHSIKVTCNLDEKSKINLKIYYVDPKTGESEETPIVDRDFTGKDSASFKADPGEYNVKATVVDTSNGTIDITEE